MARNRFTATATIERDGREFTAEAVAWRYSRDGFPTLVVGTAHQPGYGARRFGVIDREGATRWTYIPDGAPQNAFTYSTLTKALQDAAEDAAAIVAEQTLAEEEAARQSPPADEVTTACSDCGLDVPVLRAGNGDPHLARCPVNVDRARREREIDQQQGIRRAHSTSHRVPRDEHERVRRLREVQRRLAVSS